MSSEDTDDYEERFRALHFCQQCRKEFVGMKCPYCGWERQPSPFYSTGERWWRDTSYREKPTALWYLVPILFGAIGGGIGYNALKNEDENMALIVLVLGIIRDIIPILWSLTLFF